MTFFSRADWQASAPRATQTPFGVDSPNSLTVHAVGANVGLHDSYLATVKAIQNHAFAKGLSDCDYNYLVDYLGNIYEGRLPNMQSGAQGVGNSRSLSVCVLDNGDGDVPFTEAVKTAILELRDQHCVGADPVIHPHRFWNDANVQAGHANYVTFCPGNEIAAWCDSPHPKLAAVPVPTQKTQQTLDGGSNVQSFFYAWQRTQHSFWLDLQGYLRHAWNFAGGAGTENMSTKYKQLEPFDRTQPLSVYEDQVNHDLVVRGVTAGDGVCFEWRWAVANGPWGARVIGR